VTPYTGQPCDWVLAGGSGHKDLLVRFGSADGDVSPVVTASITVDTVGPVTVARVARRAGGGRTTLCFSITDPGSGSVDATVVVKGGAGQTRRYKLGRVGTGTGTALVKLPEGSYTWRVDATDLAGRTQVRQTTGKLVVR